MGVSKRIDFDTFAPGTYWADEIAMRVIAEFPNEELYTCAAGISPSGTVHFGNFRDVITAYAVGEALKEKGARARVIFSWDNFDRFRKVPANVDASFAQYIGMPLTKVPDPCGEHASYAEHFQKPFESAMHELGIELEYKDQTVLYESGAYDARIFDALKRRGEIADALLSFMTEKAKEEKGINEAQYRSEYYPISVYSRFTGKDNTTVLAYDGSTTITYRCNDTGNEEAVDLSREHIAKLAWKIDWPMRWQFENVHFEPAGHDHASPGGSFDTSSQLVETIFAHHAPVFAEYKFVGIQGSGAKMSGSKGDAISPQELLEIYDPILLRWLYMRKMPDQTFMLSFDTEIYRQYEEFDRECIDTELDSVRRRAIELSVGSLSRASIQNPIPFRQAVAYGQIVQWNREKLDALFVAAGLSFSKESIDVRMPRARAWLEKYNPEEKIELLAEPHAAYVAQMSDAARALVQKLHTALKEGGDQSIEELEHLVYAIPKEEGIDEKELKKRQRAFFADVYQLLIGQDTGPRLATFLWAVDRARVLQLLTI